MYMKKFKQVWCSLYLVYSYFSFSNINPLIRKGMKRQLDEDSALEFAPEDNKCAHLIAKFETKYKKLSKNHSQEGLKNHSILKWTLFHIYWDYYFVQLLFAILESTLK